MTRIHFLADCFSLLGQPSMISIIIPAHNEKENLESLLPILTRLNTTLRIEILVALSSKNNDGSEMIQTAPSVAFINCEGKGRATQMNAAVKESTGEILVFLHADVTPPKTFFQDIAATLAGDYDAGFFSYKFDQDSFLLNINASFTSKDGMFTGGGDQCLFIEKRVFLKLGGFNEGQELMEDFEFFDRMKKHKVPYKIIKNDLIVSARKYHDNSYFRVNFSNLLLVVLYKFGYPSKKLKSLHNKLLRTSYRTNT